MITIDEYTNSLDRRSTGFDYMRIILAMSVVAWHSISTSYGVDVAHDAWGTPLRPFATLILPMFFCLSGFLVAGSLERSNTIGGFLYLRAIRIFPALAVEITISALILGPLLTSKSLVEYYTDKQFFSYFMNIFGIIRYQLPGVFENNPYPNVVNGQLWTVPYELECYIALSLVAVFGIYRSQKLMVIMGSILALGLIGLFFFAEPEPYNVSGRILVVYFLFGVLAYKFRKIIPYNFTIFVISAILSLILLSIVNGGVLAIIPLTYVTVYLGLTNFDLPKILKSGDYSYGIFLYGFAIQQAIVHLLPWARTPLINTILALLVVSIIAAFSWHLIEKPILGIKKYTKNIDEKISKTKVLHFLKLKN